ncbi:DUF2189 domain-containing protein [Rheinheimera salexigens]|uniref:DUF624 domain-containing protein n=1 Tax=Rheinheimera salexigens TaxID=1628148 RepID=A0A1E7Q8E0_9GAMM|nr:hypothetical protein [Rheinheimera salexigens]OEY70462.1 hypothetical protein BI198_13465 [Rheinheimera salexigens]
MNNQFRIKLIVRRVKALSPLQWLQQGWQIFKQAPMIWLLMFFTLIFTAALGSLHTLLNIAALFISPFLTAGIYKSIVDIQQKKTIQYTDMFTPLQQPSCRMVFIRLAAINMLAAIPLSVLAQTIYNQQLEGINDPWLLLLFVASSIIIWMVFAYAVAIAYFLQEHRLLAIMQASFVACWRNITPLAVFAGLSFLLILLTVPTMFIGLIVVIPVLNIAFFLSFNDFFALQVNTKEGDGVLEV